MREKVYIETTIPSYLAAKPSRDLLIAARQRITQDWWETRGPSFDLYISQAVLEEAGAGDNNLANRRLGLLSGLATLALTREALELAKNFVGKGAIPPKAAGDALHIAMASIYDCEYLLTWNCRHIANAEIQKALRRVTNASGLDLPAICTPEELMGEDR